MSLDPAIAEMERRWKESGIPGLYEGSGDEMRERARNVRQRARVERGLRAKTKLAQNIHHAAQAHLAGQVKKVSIT